MGELFVIIGGDGRLGKALSSYLTDRGEAVSTMTHTAFDITKPKYLPEFDNVPPAIVINCAAVLPPKSESMEWRFRAWAVNTVGAGNLGYLSDHYPFRLIHISTDAVFGGEYHYYTEKEPPAPVNYYGLTKAAGEAAVLAANPDALILRPAFRHDGPWPFPSAFTDAYRSAVWLSQLLPDMVSAILMPDLSGILHMGGPRRSVYDMAREVSPGVLPGKLEDFKGWRIARDLTLDCGKWERMKRERGLA